MLDRTAHRTPPLTLTSLLSAAARLSYIRYGAVFFAVLLCHAPAPARACSICLSGDPTIHNLGVQTAHRGQWRTTLEFRAHSKTNALENQPYPQYKEFEHENRLMWMTSYAPSERLLFGVNIPFLDRSHTSYSPLDNVRTSASNFGDIEVQSRFDVLSSRTRSFARATSVIAGIVPPTGNNDAVSSGTTDRIDEHVQPGSGAWAEIAGVAQLVHSTQNWGYASVLYRHLGSNKYGYHYGSSLLVTTEVGHQFSPRLSATAGIAGRSTGRDLQGQSDSGQILPPNTFNPESGGEIAFFTPGVQVRAGMHLSFRGEAYLPVWSHLTNTQHEDPNVLLSVTFAP